MAEPPTTLQRIKGAFDTVLVVDVFVVIAGALWFAVAVTLHSQKFEAPLELFQRLWESRFLAARSHLKARFVKLQESVLKNLKDRLAFSNASNLRWKRYKMELLKLVML